METSLTTLGNTSRQRKEKWEMNVICFGDSNTYGYDPRSYLGGRYAADSRWVDIPVSYTHLTLPTKA